MPGTTPTARRSGAAWWAPLLADSGLLEAGNTEVGFVVSGIDFAVRPPVVRASTARGSAATVRVDPEIGAAALRSRFAAEGLVLPNPALADVDLYRTAPDPPPPALVHAWALDELTNSDAFPGRSPRERAWRVDLRAISGTAERIEVTLHLVARGYAVRLGVDLDDPHGECTGLGYTLTSRALAEAPERLEPMEPHHGVPLRRGPRLSAAGWE